MLSADDRKRIEEILKLGDDTDSRDVWTSVEWAHRLKQREDDPLHRRAGSRKRLEQIEKRAHALVLALRAVPAKADETIHLSATMAPPAVDWDAMTMSVPTWSIDEEIERVARLERACKETLAGAAYAKVGNRPKQNWSGPI